MSIEVTDHEASYGSGVEKSVEVLDTGNEDDKGFTNGLKIHPWHRYLDSSYEDHSVYVSVGWFAPEGYRCVETDVDDEYQNVIVNREDFVEAILAVFPELKRADV